MNDNDSGTKSFEPVKTSSDAPKKNAPDFKKIVKLSIFAVAIIVLALFCAIIITEIAYKVGGSKPEDNANGKLKYTETQLASSDSKKGTLLIINKTYAIGAEIKAEAAGKVQSVPGYNATKKAEDANFKIYYGLPEKTPSLLPVTIDAFNRMTADLNAATGCADILLAYGYLVPKDTTLECDYPHELGTVVDIKITKATGTYPMSSNEAALNWLNQNAAKYGFINSDPTGTVHGTDEVIPSTQYRYVGVAHASYIAEKGISIDSYVELLRNSHNSPENALSITGADGNAYSVYYVAASSEQYTTVKVPENYNYTVSGDNIGGFIITINLSEKK